MWWLVLVGVLTSAAAQTPCGDARMRCAYRSGCGAALNNYLMLCNDVLSHPTTVCPEACGYALIALTSTIEGKELMNCQCKDQYCEEAKQRIDVCRPMVFKGTTNAMAIASCSLSQLICIANAQCAAALGYYHQFCRSMYRGRKCSYKCRNSIDILKKQEKASALTECQCDGMEDYDCPRMQSNLQRLCFHKHSKNHTKTHYHNLGSHKKKSETSNANSISVSLALISIVYCLMLRT